MTLKLINDLMYLVERGDKVLTIRKGKRDIDLGILTLESTEQPGFEIEVEVTSVLYCKIKHLPLVYVINDGYTTREELVIGLSKFYSDITKETEITCIIWDEPQDSS